MAINKDFLVKNGIDVGQNATITGSLTAAGLSYPVSDGDQFQAIITDGLGNLSFGNVDTVESDVTNNTGSLIPKGTPVYQTGAAGNTLTIAPSDASDAATMPAIGVAASDIADGDTGRVIHFGYIHGVDTSAFSEGDRIYVADGGGYQIGRPTGETNVVQFLGVVTKVHATNGSGVIFGGGRAHAVPNLNDGNIFIGDNTNSPVTATLDTLIVPENSNLYFTDQRAVDAVEAHPHLTIDGGTLYVDTDNNYVGIGDTSPQEKLDVAGNLQVQGNIIVTGTVDGVDVASFKTAYDNHNHDAEYVNVTGDTMTGNLSFGDNDKAIFGAGSDLQIYHNGFNSVIADVGTGNLVLAVNDFRVLNTSLSSSLIHANDDGAVTAYHNGSPKLATTSTGIDVTGSVVADTMSLPDGGTFSLGTSSDLQIYHDGTHSYVRDNGTGALKIMSNGDAIHLYDTLNSQYMAYFNTGGAAILTYAGASKLSTTYTGIDVTGTVTASAFEGSMDFGSITDA